MQQTRVAALFDTLVGEGAMRGRVNCVRVYLGVVFFFFLGIPFLEVFGRRFVELCCFVIFVFLYAKRMWLCSKSGLLITCDLNEKNGHENWARGDDVL